MKTFATLTAAGVAGLLLLKLLSAVILPALGLLLGIVALTVKFAVIAALGFFVYTMFKKVCSKTAV